MKVPPASAGSGARKRGDREYEIIKKQKAGIYRRINIVLRWMPAFLSNVFC